MRPYLRAANVTWQGLALDDVKSMNFTDSEMATYRLERGDLLLSEASGSPTEVGKPALWNGEISDCAFQNTLLRIRPRNQEPRFLLHFFRFMALSGRFMPEARGVGINHLGRARLAGWIVPIPELPEQRRIVEIIEDHFSRLDAGERGLSQARVNLEALESLAAHSLAFTTAFKRASLSAVALLVTDGDHNPPKRTETGIPHVTAKGVRRDGTIDLTICSYVSPEGYAQTARRYTPAAEDILVTCVGTIGRVAVVPHGMIFSADRNLAAVRVDKSLVLPQYVAMTLRSIESQHVMSTASGSTAQPHLYLKDLRRLAVPLPPLDVQAELVGRFEEVTARAQRLVQQLSVQKLLHLALRRAILAAAFSGRLTGSASDADRIDELASAAPPRAD